MKWIQIVIRRSLLSGLGKYTARNDVVSVFLDGELFLILLELFWQFLPKVLEKVSKLHSIILFSFLLLFRGMNRGHGPFIDVSADT